jgi:uncharacterized protein (TIGR02246 family)
VTGDRNQAAADIRAVVDALARAWRSGDGDAWGSCFADDAEFTSWFGLRLSGRDAIASGHQQIFDTFYENTEYRLEIEWIKFLDERIALVALAGSIVGPEEEEPTQPQTVPLAVLVRAEGAWKIAAFQNTHAAQLEQRMAHGDVREK